MVEKAHQTFSSREPGNVGRARDWVRATCFEWVPNARCDALVLVTSELVTNSLVHGSGDIEVDLTHVNRHIRIEVTDEGTRPIREAASGPDTTRGRGLQIVRALSTRWGSFQKDGTGNTVWAELGDDVTASPNRA